MANRLQRAALIGVLAIGSLAIWTAIPAGWMWVTREIEGAGRFLIVIFGCVASMSGAAVLLYRLQDALHQVRGEPDREPGPPSWLRAAGTRRREPSSLLDVFLVVSAIIAAIALVVWWAFFADSSNPSGPLQPL